MNDRVDQLLQLAGDFASELIKWTARLPEEERYMMVPMLRDAALSMVENTALGLARYHPADRFRLLVRAQASLEEVHSRLALCKVIGLLLPKDEGLLEGKYFELRKHLTLFAEALHRSIRHRPPS